MSSLLPPALMAELAAISEGFMEKDGITIVDTIPVDDGAGSSTETETTRTVDGSFWTVSGTEAGEDQVKVKGKYRVEVDASVVMSPTAKIIYKGKTYAVKFPPPIGTFDPTLIIGVEDV